jgi:hypothetical protein
MFVEVHKQDDTAIGHHQPIFVARYEPLVPHHPHVEETVLDETLHVRMADIRVRPLLH